MLTLIRSIQNLLLRSIKLELSLHLKQCHRKSLACLILYSFGAVETCVVWHRYPTTNQEYYRVFRHVIMLTLIRSIQNSLSGSIKLVLLLHLISATEIR